MGKIGFFIIIVLSFSFKASSQNEINLTTEEKLYGLSKLWKESSYNFAFFDQVPNLNWLIAVSKLIFP